VPCRERQPAGFPATSANTTSDPQGTDPAGATGDRSVTVDLLQGEQILYRGQPSPRSSVAFFARWGTLALVPGVLATVLAANGWPTVLSLGDWWVITIVLLVLVIIRNTVVRHSMRFMVTSQRIIVRRGILSRTEQTTALVRVQNITVRQTVVQRMLGIGDVEFDTAGGDPHDADFRFVGITGPQDVVRTVDFRTHAQHQDAWTGGL
jgi:uncharacterized membrane protein YdbT with pleckstrin-like domain